VTVEIYKILNGKETRKLQSYRN